jgi:hypothetical protein
MNIFILFLKLFLFLFSYAINSILVRLSSVTWYGRGRAELVVVGGERRRGSSISANESRVQCGTNGVQRGAGAQRGLDKLDGRDAVLQHLALQKCGFKDLIRHKIIDKVQKYKEYKGKSLFILIL